MKARTQNGFTLIEMMIVVVLIVVLSVVAIGAYRKHLDSARKSEVVSMFAEIRNRQEAYRSEFSQYLSLSLNEDDFWPKLLAVNEPTAKDWQPAPAPWNTAGINPGKAQLYCGYSVVAGLGGGLAGAGARGTAAFPVIPTTPWWYVTGTCDNDGNSAVNAIFVTTSESQTVYEQNPHE